MNAAPFRLCTLSRTETSVKSRLPAPRNPPSMLFSWVFVPTLQPFHPEPSII
jgi:hypothetical protein